MKRIEIKVHPLLNLIPKDQIEKVFNQSFCDIHTGFLGFMNTYEKLSQIVPKDFTVIDLGCAYNPQCFYFLEHKKYIAVDIGFIERFCSPNCTIFEKTIKNFIDEDLQRFDLDTTFAICNYVPSWHDDNGKLVRDHFKNVFVFCS